MKAIKTFGSWRCTLRVYVLKREKKKRKRKHKHDPRVGKVGNLDKFL